MQKTDRIIGGACIGLLAAVFAYWAFSRASSLAGLLAGALSCALFAAIMYAAVPGITRFFTSDEAPFPDEAFGARSLRRERRHPWIKIVLCALAFRLVLYMIAYGVYTWKNGYEGGLWDTLRTLWLRTDSPSYLGIAENGYVTEGDARFHIVFFPLYPLCIRAASYLINDYFASAMVVSNVLAAASAVACYELTALEMPFEEAKRSVRYMLVLPAAFFLGAPMTESLFLFLSLITLYFARKRRFLPACIFAALASLSRLPGLLLAAPVAMEMIAELCQRKRAGESIKRAVVWRVFCLIVLFTGIAAYLYVNYRVTGDAFNFMRYQNEHWQQGANFFFDASAYQLEYAISDSAAMRWELFVPNLAACFGALALMLFAVKKMRASYAVYFLVYFAVTTGASWLLSAPRYLASAYPLMLACTELGGEPSEDVLLTVICASGLLIYMSIYTLGGFVY